MPWKEQTVLEERLSFVRAFESGEASMASLCRLYEVSRPTGYKWVERYRLAGAQGLLDLPRAPRSRPRTLDAPMVEWILAMRRKRKCGPGMLRTYLMREEPDRVWPAVSTIAAVLREHGLTKGRRKKPSSPPDTSGLRATDAPNAVWGADFKGWFHTGDGARCLPFTMTDLATRYALRCTSVARGSFEHVQPLMEAAFRQYGLPWAIRTDNGPPFASTAPGGLSRLSVWLIHLSIYPERIVPGKPQQNGRHERFHRTLKEATASPPRASLRAQQRAFDQFRRHYNDERPHQALESQAPASVYMPSPRPYPERLPEINYPDEFSVVRVYDAGSICFKSCPIFLTERLANEYVGLKPIDERYWQIYFGPVELGTLDTHKKRFVRPKRKRPKASKS